MRISAGVIGLHGAKLPLALSLALVIYGASGASKAYGSERQKVSEGPRPDGTSSAPSSKITWTRRDLPGRLPGKYRLYFLEDVAYGNGIFVAAGARGPFSPLEMARTCPFGAALGLALAGCGDVWACSGLCGTNRPAFHHHANPYTPLGSAGETMVELLVVDIYSDYPNVPLAVSACLRKVEKTSLYY